ncbi:MAG TPA: GNAT family N-acetyltransferase [Candidatus Bipolaricaulota bacterium]
MHEYQQGEFTISTDPARLDVDVIHGFLSKSYWAQGRSRETVVKSLENSLCFGVYKGNQQVGLARVITDYATFAYVCDVFILEDYQGQGLGKWLMKTVTSHPQLQGLRRWTLATRDAHGLYQQVGFTPFSAPERWMEKLDPTANPPPTQGS